MIGLIYLILLQTACHTREQRQPVGRSALNRNKLQVSKITEEYMHT